MYISQNVLLCKIIMMGQIIFNKFIVHKYEGKDKDSQCGILNCIIIIYIQFYLEH